MTEDAAKHGGADALRVGVAGTGAIGFAVMAALDAGGIAGCRLVAFAASSSGRGGEINAKLTHPVPIRALADLAQDCDLVVECLPPDLFAQIAKPTLEAGRVLVVLSASQILERADLIVLARRTGGRIVVPSGAILGLDALRAVREGTIASVRIVTRKPVAGLVRAPFVRRSGIELEGISEPVRILEGSVSEVAREFPANVNVAAAVSLAGIGPEETRMEIWADPALTRNRHELRVVSDSSDFTVTIENRPSPENPATSQITAQSVIAYLRGLGSPLQVGI
ncbi:putative aspartate dehydrogenase [Maritimibacter sp. 55A14]|uniref:aspartate dehydrogenase n=1 Tax=Maritimibacter sp. 55A14 TaxID=2174844 RepID=UPI000D606010|nr:aspartate dehydrogenase [Maritimibacter sp. 55A14]PWE33048.1 putative aspartate dehydrogenase [Maritimibacter sp. 55A14]